MKQRPLTANLRVLKTTHETPPMATRIYLVEDHDLVREMLQMLIGQEADLAQEQLKEIKKRLEE